MSSVPERSDIADEYTWDLADLFADDEAWEAAYEAVEERIGALSAYEGRVTESATTLAEALELRESIMRDVSDVAAYARMRRDEDTTNQRYQALTARSQSLAADASSAASFVDPELQELDRAALESFAEEVPDLATYEHYFDDTLRMKPHTRSAEIEALLADLSEVTGAASDVYNMLTNADMTFPAIEDPEGGERRITLSNFTKLQKHPDRAFRKRSYEAFYDEWDEYRNSVATAYKNSVKADRKLADARHYDSARAAALDGPNVPVDVYETLVGTVEDNLDVLHRHAELKRDALEVDELRMWDLYAPIAEGESPDLEYDRAKEYVIDAVEPLGDAYRDRMAEGLESRWVDVYETANKQSGAYSGGTYDSQPYILLNYHEDIASMYTLAHELGHSMHSELTSDEQPYVYSGYEIFVAEVASTVNEALLTRHLLETVEDERFRRHVLDEYLERFRSTLFRQTMFADFEHRAHELDAAGEALTPDRLDELYRGLKSEYYEPAKIDDRIAREWMRIPHFYRAYYVYQYATGISAANAIVDQITSEGEPAAADYREFLRSGSRAYPLELLETAGIDMSTSEPVEAAIDAYDAMVSEFASLT
ncbi:oligoendopeptidase PepF [Natronomonas moolapensis 8.8.11]|uniref:Oligoendopeptidase PepF n=1 Tax=Natronomonas moolapensis (strain DSM 18674 / CECT 7526 / JCM 14361 / 8.8.11) TaxID=268739 RepID=M1XNA0_NATM8|nr:oligoendopeptidase F [Natronomonas moolapensis]CCQ35393.1 oligoendopeptidase PepF [Natronomonas moolapensis 8.8.11]